MKIRQDRLGVNKLELTDWKENSARETSFPFKKHLMDDS